MHWKRVMFSVAVKRAYLRALGFRRADYKSTWNALSATRPVAMVGVASTADEESYDASGKVTASTLVDALRITHDDVVLEIGCGTGRIGKHIAPVCKRWIGVDISAGMLKHAALTLSGYTNVALLELSRCALDGLDECSIDCVYCSAVFMHLDEWDRFAFVREAFRVLRPGGRCYVDNINLCGDTGWSIFLEMSEYEADLRPANISKASTPEELRVYMERAGFSQIIVLPGSHFVASMGTKPHTI